MKKRTKKLLVSGRTLVESPRQRNKSFLLLFFKKEDFLSRFDSGWREGRAQIEPLGHGDVDDLACQGKIHRALMDWRIEIACCLAGFFDFGGPIIGYH